MSAETLLAEHERLCFARAFPRTAAERRRADAALATFEGRVRGVRGDLENTGIAGTRYRYPFNLTMARWLAARYGSAVEVDWAAYKRHEWDEVAALFSLIVAWAENEGLDDDDLPSWDWVRRAKGRRGGSDLSWLLERLGQTGFAPDLERSLYERLELPLVWDLSGCGESVTHARLPARRVFYHRTMLRERPADFAAEVRKPIGVLELVPRARAHRLIDAARAALSQREREFHVIVHANPDEVYRVEADRGLEVLVFGLARALRLTLESDYGALLVKNGVPIGYGYSVHLFDRADIAINIFPTYRAGESPWVFARFASLFHHHFGAQKLIMRRYQVGWRNLEGIESGSFWFYYKLGFRPVDARVAALAGREAARLARRPGARSGAAMLRRLARSDLVLPLDGSLAEDFRDADIRAIGLAVTRLIERRFGGDRRRALATLTRRVARSLGVPRVPERLAPVAALIPDLPRWPAADRRALLAVLRRKEGTRERPFVFALQRAARFRRFLARVR